MASNADLLTQLRETGALREGHFRLSSGLHSNRYVQCARLLEEPRRAQALGRALAEKLARFGADSVLSPALGGVVIGYATAVALSVPFRFCERKDDAMRLRRGFELGTGERIAVVEDVVTTGGSAREAGVVAREGGARVVTYGAIIDRSGGDAGFEAPFEVLLELEVRACEASECELCVAGEPMTAPGSRQPGGF